MSRSRRLSCLAWILLLALLISPAAVAKDDKPDNEHKPESQGGQGPDASADHGGPPQEPPGQEKRQAAAPAQDEGPRSNAPDPPPDQAPEPSPRAAPDAAASNPEERRAPHEPHAQAEGAPPGLMRVEPAAEASPLPAAPTAPIPAESTPDPPLGEALIPAYVASPAYLAPGGTDASPTVSGRDHSIENAPAFRPDPVSAFFQRQRAENEGTAMWIVLFLGAGLTAINAVALMRHRDASPLPLLARDNRANPFKGHVEEPFSEHLVEFGIESWAALKSADPAALSFWLGADKRQVERWQAQADLQASLALNDPVLRVLGACGVETLSTLADRDAEQLWQALRAANGTDGVGLQAVQDWVRIAREQIARRGPTATA